jgi:hypothetical protein
MAEAAEQLSQFQTFEATHNQHIWYVPIHELIPLVFVVPERAEDAFARHQASRFIGRVALESTVAAKPEIGRVGSLHEALQQAYTGDETARQLITTNVRTDVVERTIKAGHIMTVELDVDDQGKIWQYGQTMDSIQANTLTYSSDQPAMRRRSEAEVRNSLRIENLNRQGLLEEYAFVVFSRAADDMTLEEMTDVGFFTDTMSCAIQLTTASSTGLAMESAFVAGVAAPEQSRHDQLTVAAVVESLGIEMDSKSATELLDTPLLIHKSLLPNGVIDLVRRYDEAAGGTFFGESKLGQDYLTYGAKCAQREASFAPKVAAIVDELIAEAPFIASPVAATGRLHKLSEKHMVEQAVADNSINPLVFGSVAAAHIEHARLYQALGQTERAQVATGRAQTTAKSSSCPTAVKVSAEGFGDEGADESDGAGSTKGKKERMTCPFCHDKNQSGDPCSPNQHCNNCQARVVGGKVVSRGNGGKKAAPSPPVPPGLKPVSESKITQAIAREEQRRDQPINQTVADSEPRAAKLAPAESQLGKLAVAA